MNCPLPNESKADRIVRFIIAAVLFLTAQFWLFGIWRYIFYVLAAISLMTSLSGFCGLYSMLKINTINNKK